MLYGVQVTDKLYHIILYGVQVTDKLYHIMLYGVQVTDKLYHIMLYGVQVSSTNKTDCHDITEILLKVELSTIKQTIDQGEM
jgi:hypothetical protein